MPQSKIKALLETNDFKLYDRSVILESVPTVFVYVLRASKDVYVHTSYNPRYYIRKYRAWLTNGVTERLSANIQRILPFTKTKYPEEHVELYYSQTCNDIDYIHRAIKRITNIMERAAINTEANTNVIEVRVAEDPNYYYLIRYSTNRGMAAAIAQFTQRSLDNVGNYPVSKSKQYVAWCKRNGEAIKKKNYTIKPIATDVSIDQAKVIVKKHLKTIEGINLKYFRNVI